MALSLVPFLWVVLSFTIPLAGAQPEAFVQARKQMVRMQIQARGIHDQEVLEAMRTVPRHQFVPLDYLAEAYRDGPLPIGYGQTISQPYIVAYMTEQVRPQSDFKVLEIGTGSGYQAAVLAEIVDSVYTIEIVEALGQAARQRLRDLNYNNVRVKIADGYYGWAEAGPFDAIVVTAAANYIPPLLIEQLKDGGRMIIPVGSPFQVQMLKLIEKKQDKVRTKNLLPVRFVPFTRQDD
ncbi:protein-L-isoaspartate(D-aspartate) O-methyltransferase [uncultured Sunxiuqinia sp.]|uniref:protein-L-isoaspartate(D-aspartate) O-methyltransferase n=1 Tax=uncultured Sunxiuqinia sp. TaxID=1573825 RepID=UPI00260A77C0|nr:protein-L-isoaspartate(D-aspartate) O-methyltransferase [uncultured Sunxiuqinia sp.]